MARHQAIILKKTPIREHDELVACYTKHAGKQRYVAKSSVLASSLQGSHLDVLNHISFNLIAGRHFDILASAQVVNTFPEIKSSFSRLAQAFFVLECFDKLVYENEKDDNLWEFLQNGSCDREEFIRVLGYHHTTQIRDLSPEYFTSLQFLATLKP